MAIRDIRDERANGGYVPDGALADITIVPGKFTLVPADEMNPSGILPTEFKCLLRPIETPDKIGSILLPDEAKEKEKFATQEGILIAVSPAAFNYDGMVREQAPKPGDRVLYAKYAGFTRKGNDGVDYRIVNDKDICAVLV